MTYGVYMAAKKLKHYFQEHPIRVIHEAPMSDILGSKYASGRVAKWAIELAPYTPQYDRRDAIIMLLQISLWTGWKCSTNHHYLIRITGKCILTGPRRKWVWVPG